MRCRQEVGALATSGMQCLCLSLICHECKFNASVFCRAHESWQLPEPPNYVTFAKKLLTGGFYYSSNDEFEVGSIGSRLPLLEFVYF